MKKRVHETRYYCTRLLPNFAIHKIRTGLE
jgi:hypothetical protein